MAVSRSIASRTISFGLVNVAVKLYTAQKPQDLAFNMLSAAGNRVAQKLVDSATGLDVDRKDTLKGYDIGNGQYVTLTKEEIDLAAPAKSEIIEINEFVPLDQIDPIRYDKTYAILPDKGGTKSYGLLTAALDKVKRVAIGTLTLRDKQHIVAIRAVDGVLTCTTLFYADEIIEVEPPQVQVSDAELDMAVQLIGIKAVDYFDTGAYTDEYRARVLDIIERKKNGEVVTSAAAKPELTQTTDLMAALQKSLTDAKAKPKIPA